MVDPLGPSGHSGPSGPRGKGGYYSGALWWDPRDPRDPRDPGEGAGREGGGVWVVLGPPMASSLYI